MVKKLLTDFGNITKPSSQSDSIMPYLSMIFTIVLITIVAYGLQVTTTDIHTYAVKPVAVKNSIAINSYCNDITQTSLHFLCAGVKQNNITEAQSVPVPSLEQDLHKSVK
jgi:hypothetical protein